MSEALRENIVDEIEIALQASALPWSRRGEEWVIPAGDHLPRELHIRATDNGVRVEADLMEWDEIADESREAMALFLSRAEGDLRRCHGELVERSARLVAVVSETDLELSLPAALRGMAQGCRGMARAVRALLSPAMARAYLDFQRGVGTVVSEFDIPCSACIA
jgi:hypothetical protein